MLVQTSSLGVDGQRARSWAKALVRRGPSVSGGRKALLGQVGGPGGRHLCEPPDVKNACPSLVTPRIAFRLASVSTTEPRKIVPWLSRR
jgi:hypothetical protein